MNIVQPGSATVKSNGVAALPTCSRAARCSPSTGCSTATGTSTVHRPSACPPRATAEPLSPSPSTRIAVGSVTSLTVTRTTCSGASSGPTKNSVDSDEITRIPAPYDLRQAQGWKA